MVDKNDASNYRKVLEKRICKNKNIFDKYTPELRFITLDFKFLSYLRSILIFSEMKIDLTHINPFLEKDIVNELESRVPATYETIYKRTGAGNDFLGWVNLPSEIDENLLANIEKTAADLRKKSEIFVVVGIGDHGSAAVFHAVEEDRLILDIAEILRTREHGHYIVDVSCPLDITLKDLSAVIDLNIKPRELPAPGQSRAVVGPSSAVFRCQGTAQILHELVDIALVDIRSDYEPWC